MKQREIFIEALQKESTQARIAYLNDVCGNDSELRQSVEELLTDHQNDDSFFLDIAPPGLSATIDQPRTEAIGTEIGPYKLLEQIGEGGMGTVYVAEQKEPVRRKVALKLIKPGMDSHQVVARFEAERQALAMMNHPNIAKVLDAGTTTAGRPYFAMELVKGTPITEFCDQQKLDTPERLQLFITVCQAVQHAHQKGLIHRDIKPNNVLVEIHDVKPVPKVIDFGVAKAIGQQLTEKTLHTGISQMIGTPLYMSPEQAGLSSIDVDTRSDIYSLGVLLYEILTGHTPFESETLRKAGFDEMRRLICEVDPPRPSARISTLEARALSTVSDSRRAEPHKLSQQLRGELDWIVMKALEKDRNRRYESANGFSDDVQRYLNDEPVQACPPSARYRLRKFVRRNKGPVGVSLALAALLLLGTMGTSIGLVWALQAERAATLAGTAEAEQRQVAETQRDRAQTAEKLATDRLLEVTKEKERATAAETQAKEEAAIAQAVNDFLQNDLLAEAAPDKNARSRKVTVEEVLGRAAARIAGKFDQQPRIEAAILQTIGDTYHALGDYPAAQPHLERAWEIRRRVLGEEHPDTLGSTNSLAALYQDQGQLAKAEPLFVKALEISRRVMGEEHLKTLSYMNFLALLYQAQGQFAKAEPLFVDTLEVRRRLLGDEHQDTFDSMNNLGMLYQAQVQYSKAEPFYVNALELRRRFLGEEHPDTLASMNNLASLYQDQAQFAKAEPLFVDALELRRRVLGDEHPRTLDSTNNLGLLYKAQDQFSKAEPLLLKTLEVCRHVLGEEHPDTLSSMNSLALLYQAQGQFVKAEPLFVEALEVRRRVLGEEHPNTLQSMNNLAGLYWGQGQLSKSEPILVDALEVRRRVLGEEHPDTLASMNNLGMLYQAQGQLPKAEPFFLKTLEACRRVLGEEHPNTLKTMSNLATLYEGQGQFTNAERLYREALETARERNGDASLQAASALASLGLNLLKQHKYADSDSLLRECLKIREQKEPDDWKSFNTKSLLGASLLGQKNYAEAEPQLLDGYEGMKQRDEKIPPQGKVRLTEAIERLVQFFEATSEKDKAAKWRKKLPVTKSAEPAETTKE